MSSEETRPPEVVAVERAVRVCDQSCTIYSILRDRYHKRSTLLDLAILLLSAWLTAMAFVQSEIASQLTPGRFSKDLWIGLLSVSTFGLSLVQLQVNWKGRSIAYQSAATSCSAFVKEFRPLLSAMSAEGARIALVRYQGLTEAIEPIPNSQFLALKRAHAVKLAMSKFIDKHPAASLTVLRLRLWWRDTVRAGGGAGGQN